MHCKVYWNVDCLKWHKQRITLLKSLTIKKCKKYYPKPKTSLFGYLFYCRGKTPACRINCIFLTVVSHDHLSFHFGTVGQNALDFSSSRSLYVKHIPNLAEKEECRWCTGTKCIFWKEIRLMNCAFKAFLRWYHTIFTLLIQNLEGAILSN